MSFAALDYFHANHAVPATPAVPSVVSDSLGHVHQCAAARVGDDELVELDHTRP
jgi:hypothetical protein